MKFFVSFFVFLLCIVYSHQLWQFKNCPKGHPALESKNELACGVMTCTADGATGKGCGTYDCLKPKGYKDEDPKKPYPDCCGGPICD